VLKNSPKQVTPLLQHLQGEGKHSAHGTSPELHLQVLIVCLRARDRDLHLLASLPSPQAKKKKKPHLGIMYADA
jgi:hypothetical protein